MPGTPPPPPPQGCTLIFSYIRRLGPFLGFKISNFDILGVFRKMNIFWDMEIFVNILGVITKTGLVLGVIYMHLGSFFKINEQNGEILGGC